MNAFNQRQVVSALVVMAGLAGCAAQRSAVACPPEEGGSPDPAQVERQVMAQTLPGVTYSTQPELARAERLVAAARRQPGSTLETRVYKPGEAATLYHLQPAVGGNTFRSVRVVKDGNDVRVVQRGEKIKATVNGKDVPDDAVTVKDNTIEVRDAEGKTVLKEEWAPLEGTFRALPPVNSIRTLPGITYAGEPEETPRVMLGITMDTADEDAVQQLGLPEGEYAIISTVPKGLPADKAGLQPRDIVVSVDGKTPGSSDTIRDVMKTKKPGDKLNVEVARKGDRLKVEIPLEAFDRTRFPQFAETMGHDSKAWEQIARDVRNKAISGQMKSQAELDALREKYRIAIPRGENGEPQMFVTPDSSKLESRLNAMQAQLERLEAMLRRFESGAAVPPLPPVPPVPPVSPIPPSGGGGSPAPSYAIGV